VKRGTQWAIATGLVLGVVAAIFGLSQHRRSQTVKDDAGATVMFYTPFGAHALTVGELEDGLRTNTDGCAHGDAWRCIMLGDMYRQGSGVARDGVPLEDVSVLATRG
jgi:hypothetical protein